MKNNSPRTQKKLRTATLNVQMQLAFNLAAIMDTCVTSQIDVLCVQEAAVAPESRLENMQRNLAMIHIWATVIVAPA